MDKLPASPLFSIIIPLFNKADFIVDTIDSALSQADNAEVIVVDDGSTDASPEAVSVFGNHIRYFRRPNRGPSAARNYGASGAKGRYLVFLDGDDHLCPGALETFSEVLQSFASADIVLTSFSEKVVVGAPRYHFLSDRLGINAADLPIGLKDFRTCLALHQPPGAFCIRKQHFVAIGGFAEALRCWEISDFLIRALLDAEFYVAENTVTAMINKQASNSQYESSRRNLDFQKIYAHRLLAYLSRMPSEERPLHITQIQGVLYSLLVAGDITEFKAIARSAKGILTSKNFGILSRFPVWLISFLYRCRRRVVHLFG